MKAPKSLFDRPGRAAAAVGAVVAVSATAAVALVSGTAIGAPAEEPGRCTQNVNVRQEPDIGSQIVALCEAGSEVKVGESRAGFVRLTNLGGWAAQEYISVNGQPPAPAERASEGEDAEQREATRDGRDGEDSTSDEESAGSDESTGSDGSAGSDESGSGEESDEGETSQPAQRSGGGLGGLLG